MIVSNPAVHSSERPQIQANFFAAELVAIASQTVLASKIVLSLRPFPDLGL